MRKSLVTGGAGFIGSHVAECLLRRGHRVTVLDDLSGGFADNVAPGVDLVAGSITDVDLVERLFSERRFDYVFHLAAYAAEGLSHFIKRFNYTNNLLGSVNLINASVNTVSPCWGTWPRWHPPSRRFGSVSRAARPTGGPSPKTIAEGGRRPWGSSAPARG